MIQRIITQNKWPFGQKITLFLLVIGLTAVYVKFFLPADFPAGCVNALILLLVAIGLWVTNAIPAFAVSMFVIGYSVYFLDDASAITVADNWEKYVVTWANPAIWIMMGGFFLSLGVQLTGLDVKVAQMALRMFGTKPVWLLLGIMLLTAFFSMLISNTATAAMMLAIVSPIAANDTSEKRSLATMLVLGVAVSATFGGMGTIVGSPVNVIAVEAMAKTQPIDFVAWARVGLPLALFFVLITWLFLFWVLKPTNDSIKITQNKGSTPSNNLQQWITAVTLVVTVLLWLTTGITKLPVAAVSFVPMVILTITGVIRQSHIKLISWDTLLLVAGGLTLGMAAHESGLLDYLVTKLVLPNHVLLGVMFFSFITVSVSNVMSNTAAAGILIPLGVTMFPEQPMWVAFTVSLSASAAVLLPISTPPNAIALSTGYIHESDFKGVGLLAFVTCPIVVTMFAKWLLGI